MAETRYHVVFDDGECRSVWAADVRSSPPPGATVGADGPNARARAIVAESEGKSKRPRADAAPPLPSPKRARLRTSATVGRDPSESERRITILRSVYDEFSDLSTSQLRQAMQARGIGCGAYDGPVDFRRKLRAYEAKRTRVETESDAAAAPPVFQSVRRRRWGAGEETELRKLVEEHRPESSEDWRQLAELHGNGRSEAAVKKKWKDLTASAPNAQARAIESQGTSKRPRADAAPRPKRARTSTSATVGHARPCEIRKVGESIWRRFASVRTAAESLALYFPDLISSTVTLYFYHLLANNQSCPCYFREAFEARYVDEPDATAPPVPDQATQSASPAPASIVVSRPPSPRSAFRCQRFGPSAAV